MNILCVCTGNICRSPLAHVILKKLLPDAHIDSCGTSRYEVGQPADSRSITVAQNHGLDLTSHRAKHVSQVSVETFDYILCMQPDHVEYIVGLFPSMKEKTILLSSYVGMKEIPDPWYLHDSSFEKTYELLVECCEKFISDKLI